MRHRKKVWVTIIILFVVAGSVALIYRPLITDIIRPGRAQVSQLVPTDRTFQVNGHTISAKVAVAPPSGMTGMAYGAGMLRYRRVALKDVAAFELRKSDVIFQDVDPDDKRDLLVALPADSKHLLPEVLRQVVQEAYGVLIQDDTRLMDVYVLRSTPGASLSMTIATAGNGSYQRAGKDSPLESKGMSIDQLAVALRQITNVPIINETSNPANFNVNISFTDTDSKEIVMQDVAAQTGLSVVLEKRMQPVAVVKPAASSKK